MIVKSYKSRSEESRAMFLLSSKNFLQAYKRAQYMKQYTSFRKIQGEEIRDKSKELLTYNEKLDVQKTAKQKIIQEKEKERISLEEEKKIQQKLVNSIKKDKNKIATDIKKKQQESKAIDKQIDRLIRQAIVEVNRKAAAERAKTKAAAIAIAKEKKAAKDAANGIKTTKTPDKEPEEAVVGREPVSSTKIDLTPEAQILSDNFRANKGRLPFPVERGFISLGFGNQPHPVYKSLVVHNSGVEITTDQGANARAVFDGVVSSIKNITPVNKVVTILHGDYFTVYHNLSTVNVNVGEKVNRKQSIGKVRTNGDTGKTIIKFLILQNTTYINPATWLSN
jgi:septal ring factor EnvC (AmiA/AmiB activator)